MFGNKTTKTILIEGMHCEHCSKRVKDALMNVKGVKSANISLETKKAEVTLKTNVSNDVLKETVEDIGFEVIEINDCD